MKDLIRKDLDYSGKVIILYGPRQSGKTTLSKMILREIGLKSLSINADQSKYIDIVSSRDLNKLQSLVAGYDLLFIDEGQRVPEIGINLKILHDEIPELKILVTGSSSFLLSNRVTEALTGRKRVYTLLPIAMKELSLIYNTFELTDQLDERLIYGLYPEVINLHGIHEKEDYLMDISSSYLYKDILELENIRYPLKIRDLIRLLAFQVGSQVSINELCSNLKLNRETVERYLHLLEQSFIIFRLTSFSKNPRKEISKLQKFYFYDNGIRNIMIDDLRGLPVRNDIGQLWENFVISERRKKLLYEKKTAQSYFWRTYANVELDYIEEENHTLKAYEIKYSKSKRNPPRSWTENYGENYACITKDNFLQYIL
ncbi:MAG: ATP-binding protein [Bacteroidales bacterium]|nr:ATP-binding protein [Bacteroidales bacterium]